MIDTSSIREHSEIVGADGQHVGTVDRVEGGRIKLTKADNLAGHADHHHFIDISLVKSVDAGRIQLSVRASEAMASEEEQSGRSAN